MADNRTYPEVEFIHKTTAEIEAELIESWEKHMGRTLGRADPIRVMLGWEAMIDAQLYEAINESAKLNVPRYAFGEYLDSLAENFHFGLERLDATAAVTTMRFAISEIREWDTAVPVGTRVTGNGSVMFETTDTGYISAGEMYADLPARCTETGTIGNGWEEGTLNILVDNDAVEGLESVKNITESEGGSAEESDEAFYRRMRESMGAYSTAGPEDGYRYHAVSANPQVSGVKVKTPGAGQVDVYVMLKGGELPGEEVLEQIQKCLSAKNVRPLTDLVTVKAPSAKSFDVDVTWYLERNVGSSREMVETKVEQAVSDYVTWQTAEIGRDINPSYLIHRIMEAGAKRVEVTEPQFVTVGETEAAVVGEISCAFGGEEDA